MAHKLVDLQVADQRLDDLQDAIEERAAIMEYDAGLPRATAENMAAQAHGFADWRAWKRHKREAT